jgi:uncharacterized protein DUF6675
VRTTQHCLQVRVCGAGLVLLVLLWPVGLRAQDMPVPPCGAPAQPAFPDPGAPPNLQVWKDRASNAAWVPPSCTGWTEPGFRMLVALAASFRFDGDGKDLLGRLGAISALRGIQYWSASDQSWRVLITDAAALEGPSIKHRRPDFAATEMGIRKVVYFLQDDSRSSGPVVYRLQVLESGPARLVVQIENVSPVSTFMLTLFHPGDLQFVYFLEARLPGLWTLYSLSRTGRGASSLSSGHEASYVSRAVAFYRHIVGIPTDQNPPIVYVSK